jgi:hypothetical protein
LKREDIQRAQKQSVQALVLSLNAWCLVKCLERGENCFNLLLLQTLSFSWADADRKTCSLERCIPVLLSFVDWTMQHFYLCWPLSTARQTRHLHFRLSLFCLSVSPLWCFMHCFGHCKLKMSAFSSHSRGVRAVFERDYRSAFET